jgi:hypothetical protein
MGNTGTAGYAAGIISSYTDLDSWDDYNTNYMFSGSSTGTAPALPSSRKDDMLLRFYWKYQTITGTITPDTDTERYDAYDPGLQCIFELATSVADTDGSPSTTSTFSTTFGGATSFSVAFHGPPVDTGTVRLSLTPTGSEIGPDSGTIALKLVPAGTRFQFDDFNRINGGLGANWTTFTYGASSANPVINANNFRSTSGYASAYYNVQRLGPDIFFSATHISSYNWIWAINSVSPLNGYTLRWQNGGTDVYIMRVDSGNEAFTVASVVLNPGPATGDKFALARVGNVHTAYVKRAGSGDWIPIASGTDSTYTGEAYAGLTAYSGNIDDFAVQDWAPLPPVNYTESGTSRLTLTPSAIEIQFRTFLDAGAIALHFTPITTHECVKGFKPSLTAIAANNKWIGRTFSGFNSPDQRKHYAGIVADLPKEEVC